MTKPRHILPILLVIGLLFAAFSPILAAADLRRSDPTAGALLDRAPAEVFAWFSSPLSTGSKLGVFDGQFQPVDKGQTFIDASDATLMRVQLAPLAPGRYTVNWTASGVDGHVTSGSYDFTVREASGLSPVSIAMIAAGILLIAVAGLTVSYQVRRRATDPI